VFVLESDVFLPAREKSEKIRLGPVAGTAGGATLDHVMVEEHHWGVPAMAYVVRLHELGLLSDWHYRSYCIELTKQATDSTNLTAEPMRAVCYWRRSSSC
jgi:Zn-dependent peptidase ImmA (M78 family)